MGCGKRKSLPELGTMMDHTSLALHFISNVSNRAWHNGLSSVSMDPHQETAAMATAASVEQVVVLAPTMIDRVQKRVLDVYLNVTNTPPTKKIAAKVHTQITRNDAAFTAVIDGLQHTQCLQEITSARLDLQRAMD
jgi:hypothetical protein